jgi:hypothetical protein
MVGWMLIDSKSLQPYAWVVRCADHPPQDEALWEPRLGLTARSRQTARNAVSI